MRIGVVAPFVLSVLVVLPGFAWAQSATTGSIAGVVRDTSGAVLPGVSVEAASPALIEKVRTARRQLLLPVATTISAGEG